MTLMNLPTELDEQGAVFLEKHQPKPKSESPPPEPKLRASVGRAYLMKQTWEWNDLRDFVVYEIERRFGHPERSFKEQSIFKGFIKRWGAEDARRIAEYAFRIEDGIWRNKPVDIYRFTANSDEHFADVIIKRLHVADQY